MVELDKQIFLALNGDMGAFADNFFWILSGKLTWIPLYLLILWFVYKRAGWKNMLLFLAVVALSVIVSDHICNIFKHGIQKLRPTHTPDIEAFVHTVKGYRGGLYGTFSAHAATCFSVAIITSLYFKRRWITFSMFVWAASVSYSRIYLGVHFPADILFGAATGCLIGYIGYLILGKCTSLLQK